MDSIPTGGTDERSDSLESAKVRIVISWVVAALAGLIVLALGSTAVAEQKQPASATLLMLFNAFTVAYGLWSLYWGMPPVWRAWRNFLGNTGCFLIANPIGWSILLLFFFCIPFIGAMFYGPYGGGIYEYLKWRRIAKGLSSSFSSSRQSEPSLEDMLADAEAERSLLESEEDQGEVR